MYYYRIEYSFSSGIPGEKRHREYDIWLAKSSQEAADLCRGEYGHIPDLRIDRIWRLNGNNWCEIGAWE